MADELADHRLACDGFTAVVDAAAGWWDTPTPCSEWDTRGVVEHVIGFHDVLLLRPLDAKPQRPRDDPSARWALTVDALFAVLALPGVMDDERTPLVGVLTTDVVVHTWDLAKGIGVDASLDARLCGIGLERAVANRASFATSNMFGPRVIVSDDAPVQDRLLGEFGRDPAWQPVD
jgi:uncharacterized protein (TIGR03086 family)